MANDSTTFFNELAALEKLDPHRLVSLVCSAGEEWANADAAASALEEARKSVLSKYTLEHSQPKIGADGKATKGLSHVAAEARALADPRFEDHLQRMVEARKLANALRVRYDMGKMFIELKRSEIATKRAEFGMGRVHA